MDDAPEPQYVHDSDCCKFLGRYRVEHEMWGDDYDLYYCPQNGMPTVIARYGDEGPDYMSGIEGIAKGGEARTLSGERIYSVELATHPLRVAYLRAVERGYIEEQVNGVHDR